MKSRDYYLIFSTIFLLAVYIVNATFGQSLGDLSVIFPFAIIPPGLIFGIARGTIYILLSVMLLYLWFADYKQTQHHIAFHVFFWVSCVFNMLWIFFTYETSYLASVFAIFGLTVVLWKLFAIVVSHRTKRGKYPFLVTLPISLYLSWVLTASSVIATSQLVFLYMPNIAVSIVWQLGALGLGLLVGLLAWNRFRFDSVVTMLLLGLSGIAIKNLSAHPLLTIASVFAIVVIATVVSRNAIIQKK